MNNIENNLEFACPLCKGDLDYKENEFYRCNTCNKNYPIYFGIPDFRLHSPPNLSIETDIEQSKEMMKEYDKHDAKSFYATVHLAFDDSPEDLKQRYLEYGLSGEERGNFRIENLLKQIESTPFSRDVSFDSYIEVGCGKGGVLSVSAQKFKKCIGADILLKQLICAKKLFEEKGFDHVNLCCACAENLPFKSNSFSMAHSMEVIEHVRDPFAFVKEMNRLLKPEGYFCFDSPNRFTIWPECHVRVWGVGFVPEKFAQKYVRLFKDIDYIGTWPLSLFKLKKVISQQFGINVKINISPIMPKENIYTVRNVIKLLFELAKRIPILSQIIFFVAHKYDVICFKKE